MRNKVGILLLFCTLHVAFNAQTVVRRENSIDRAIKALSKDPQLKNASISFVVRDVDSNNVISEWNPDQSMISASTMKVVTTASALEILGSYAKFKTSIKYDGYIDSNCILHGNIYIDGGGDPTLGSKYFKKEKFLLFENWATEIKNLGIDSINGRVIGDGSYFSDEYVASTWTWGDIGNYYGAGSSGLSIYDNTISFEFSSGPNVGDSTYLDCFYPYSPDLVINNRVKAGKTKKDEAYIYGGPYNPFRIIKGRIPVGQEGFIVKGSMHDPSYVAAFELETALWNAGVKVGVPATTVRKMMLIGDVPPEKRTLISEHKSPSLSRIVYWTNLISNNLFADHLLKHVGVKKYHDGSVFSSTLAIKKYWISKGLDMTGFYMNDGSGLSRSNAITANQLVGILIYMKNNSKFTKSFVSSLPVAGKTGTLRTIGKRTKIYGNLKAKSGTMTRVKSYAGYVTSASGKNLSFAIIVNNYNCTSFQIKKKVEKVMVALGDY